MDASDVGLILRAAGCLIGLPLAVWLLWSRTTNELDRRKEMARLRAAGRLWKHLNGGAAVASQGRVVRAFLKFLIVLTLSSTTALLFLWPSVFALATPYVGLFYLIALIAIVAIELYTDALMDRHNVLQIIAERERAAEMAKARAASQESGTEQAS